MQAAGALFERVSKQGAFAAERGTWELFLRDGQDLEDQDLKSPVEGKQLACLLQGLRWLLCLLREPVLQVNEVPGLSPK